MAEPQPFTVIVLAAQRAGQRDPLAVEAGVSHKCLVPIVGKPLVSHVLEALAGMDGLGRIRICIEPEAAAQVQALADGAGLGGVPIDFVAARPTITESAYASAEGVEGTMLITTADNVNLTKAAARLCLDAIARGADVAFGLAPRRAVLAARAEPPKDAKAKAKIGPYRFADDAYSNCNLYALSGPRVLRMAEAFREGGQFSKHPRRLLRFIGPLNLLLLSLRLLTLDQAMKRLSRRFGLKVEAVVLEDGAQAVDVDNPRSYKAAEFILRRRLRSA